MKSYKKKCEGCGVELQSNKINLIGFIPNSDFSICQRCFKAKNYGEFSNDLNNFYKLEDIKKNKNDNVIMVIDILNPYETLISNINKYVSKENLIILVNKIDIFPKSIPKKNIIDWITKIIKEKNIKFKKLFLTSYLKKINIDSISRYILSNEKNISIIGYSNVGKSSIIKGLFNAIGEDINNIITNSIGTTKKVINLNYKKRIIKDYPGLLLEGSYQNIMNVNELKESSPKKEIKIRNYQLNNYQTINIGKYANLSIKKQKNKMGYQFSFSNLIKLKRSKYKKINNWESYIIKHIKGNRYDLIISGLGIITFKSIGQDVELNLPKGVKFNLIKSLYK